jgi:hypothetical protein
MADDAPSKRNVLKQSGIATFPVCIKRDTNVENGFVAVKFKPVAGKEDQAGGVIWRCKDKDNYYVAHANALENNVTIYHTINGQRVAFKSVKQTSSQVTGIRSGSTLREVNLRSLLTVKRSSRQGMRASRSPEK